MLLKTLLAFFATSAIFCQEVELSYRVPAAGDGTEGKAVVIGRAALVATVSDGENGGATVSVSVPKEVLGAALGVVKLSRERGVGVEVFVGSEKIATAFVLGELTEDLVKSVVVTTRLAPDRVRGLIMAHHADR